MIVVLHQYLDCCVGSDNSSAGYFQLTVKLLSLANNVWPLSTFPIYIYIYIYFGLQY